MSARILVVDDDRVIRAMVCQMLAGAGFHCTAAEDAVAAAALVQREQFDLVLSDVDMPGPSGLALVRALHARVPELPIVLMSATGGERAAAALQAGARAFLLKPFLLEDAVACIRAALPQ
jgi:DNA-binding NtrC family response regulator